MKRLLLLTLMTIPVFADTPIGLSYQLCPPGAVGPLLSGMVNFGTLLVPVCFKLGAGFSFDVATNTLSVVNSGTPSAQTTFVETMNLDPNLPQAQLTVTYSLAHPMDPKGTLIVLYKSSYAGLSSIDVKKPVGPNFQNVIVTLPTVRPFQAADSLVFVYQSLQ